MLNFDAGKVLKAITTIREMEHDVRQATSQEKNKTASAKPMPRAYCQHIVKMLDQLSEAIEGLNVKATALAVKETRGHLTAHTIKMRYMDLPDWIQDAAVTLRRELSLQQSFCIEPEKQAYFDACVTGFGKEFETKFPSAVFEIDEAGKCYALSRSTACAFHLMRAMEIGIRATARALAIPDPVKSAQRNWGSVLKSIKVEIERRDAAKSWSGGDKELFAAVYVSLDAVRIAWRNTTMHVENKYTDDEAEHILVAVRGFMRRLASRMDESGQPLA